MASLRAILEESIVIAEKKDVTDETEFIYADKAKEILDDIERRVNGIHDLIASIKGLSEIDEIESALRDLSEDLF